MKLKQLAVVGLGALVLSASAATMKTESDKQASSQMSEQDKLSYTIGVDIGENLQAQSMAINADLLAQGIKDAVGDKPLKLSKEQMQKTLEDFQKQLMEKQKQVLKEQGDKNSEQGQKFLAENKGKPGVKTLPSGLQYKVVQAGKGTSPTENDFVTVEYEGTLINGDVFDSTYKRGTPVNFKVSQVIKGWQEALQKMKPGATWMLYIPPELAYGERGLGGPIGPNETLIFKVHLVSVGPDKSSNS